MNLNQKIDNIVRQKSGRGRPQDRVDGFGGDEELVQPNFGG